MARNDEDEIDRVISCFKGWREKMVAVGFQELVFEDALDLVVELLKEIKEVSSTYFISRIIGLVTPKIIYFRHLQRTILDQSIQKHILFNV